MKQRISGQEEESAQLVKHINEIDAHVSSTSAELVNKQANMMRDEWSLKKAKQLKLKVEQASDKLAVVLDSSLSSSTSLSSTMLNVFENQQITSKPMKFY
jgi:septal ring factor EnvC (AmiA/AmiB activator)